MKGRVLLSGVLVVGLLVLSGCSLFVEPEDDDEGLTGAFTVQIVSDGPQPSIVTRAVDRSASRYRWEFYGADTTQPPTVVEGGREKSVATHTWPEVGPGAFLVVLTVESGDDDDDGNGNGGGGCCGPGPGGSGGGGGGSNDSYQVASSYQVVKFAGCAGLVPILFFTTWNGGRIGDTFYPWEKVCVSALESIGEGLTYRIEIVRVKSVDDPTPIPPDYPIPPDPSNPVTPPTPPPGVQYIITENPLYCFYIPGPGGCSGEMWTYRVTLRIRDKWWKEATLTKFIFVGCCP